jgi:hypothetical protein
VEKNGNEDDYQSIMRPNQNQFLEQRQSILLY